MKPRFTFVFAALFFLAHGLAAIILCHERLYLDASYYFFHVVNESGFRIEHQRIILALSQSLLVLGTWMRLPLSTLLQLYSITPVLYTALLVFVALRYFHSEPAAWLMMLLTICGSSFLYYCPMYEVSYAAVSLCFLWLLTERGYYQTPGQILIYSFFLIMVLFGYPLMIFGLIAIMLYQLTYKGRIPIIQLFMYILVFGLWFAMKYFFISEYEKGKITVAPTEYPGILKDMLSICFVKHAMAFLWQYYTLPLLSIILSLLYCLFSRRFAMAIVMLLSAAVYFFVVNFGYRGNGLIHSNNFERMYLVLVILAFAPVGFYLYYQVSGYTKWLMIMIACATCACGSVQIWNRTRVYSHRLALIESTYRPYQDRNCSKAAIQLNANEELDEWSTGIEALIYSSEHGKSIILSDKEMVKQKHTILDRKHFVLRLDEVLSVDDLNHHYFRLDSTEYCY